MIIVCGGTIEQARDYCAREGLGFGSAIILHDAKGLLPLRGARSHKVALVGTFHSRDDAQEILRELKIRGGVVEDLT